MGFERPTTPYSCLSFKNSIAWTRKGKKRKNGTRKNGTCCFFACLPFSVAVQIENHKLVLFAPSRVVGSERSESNGLADLRLCGSLFFFSLNPLSAFISASPCVAPCSAKPATQGGAEGFAEQGCVTLLRPPSLLRRSSRFGCEGRKQPVGCEERVCGYLPSAVQSKIANRQSKI